jgi:hypothetical protein
MQTTMLVKIQYSLFQQRGGFFVECGALDGERSSNTIWLEQNLQWTGLLIEVDPFFYTQVLGKNRRAYTANACLSPFNYVSTVGHGISLFCLIYSFNRRTHFTSL